LRIGVTVLQMYAVTRNPALTAEELKHV
jgi:hypothetical protein